MDPLTITPGCFNLDPRWRTSDVVGVAHGILGDGNFLRMPILSDAFMDAGCEDEYILGVCRGHNLLRQTYLILEILGIFTSLVDYDKELTDAITEGKYDLVRANVDWEGFLSGNDEVRGKREVRFHLYHFNREMDPETVVFNMGQDQRRPATLREILVFGKTNPEFQRYFHIIGLGARWLGRSSYRRVPSLTVGGPGRALSVHWLDDGCSANCRFLAVSD